MLRGNAGLSGRSGTRNPEEAEAPRRHVRMATFKRVVTALLATAVLVVPAVPANAAEAVPGVCNKTPTAIWPATPKAAILARLNARSGRSGDEMASGGGSGVDG